MAAPVEWFHSGIQCFVRRIEYDYEWRAGRLWTHGGVDMGGTIKAFEAIDRRVRRIDVHPSDRGYECEVSYRRGPTGKWEVFAYQVPPKQGKFHDRRAHEADIWPIGE